MPHKFFFKSCTIIGKTISRALHFNCALWVTKVLKLIPLNSIGNQSLLLKLLRKVLKSAEHLINWDLVKILCIKDHKFNRFFNQSSLLQNHENNHCFHNSCLRTNLPCKSFVHWIDFGQISVPTRKLEGNFMAKFSLIW